MSRAGSTSLLCCVAGVFGIGLVLIQLSDFAQASGVKRIGPWVVIAHDKEDGRKDVAAIVSGKNSPFGLAIRYIDANLSLALVPLNDEQLFGAPRHSATLLLQPDAQEPSAVDGVVGDDRAIYVPSPAPLVKLVHATARLVVSASTSNGSAVSATFDLTASRRALVDLVRGCPDGTPSPGRERGTDRAAGR